MNFSLLLAAALLAALTGSSANVAEKQKRGKRMDHTMCHAGHQLSEGMDFICKPCSAGTYRGITVNSKCQKCPPGSYSRAGAAACSKCWPGSFAASSGSASCQKCAKGSMAATDGLSSCTPCPAGSFISISGSPDCVQCPAGTSSEAGAAECSKCQPGHFSPAGAAACRPCPAGSYSAAGASACTIARNRWAATLTPEAKTGWGDWGNWESCPDGSLVSRFQLKAEGKQGSGDDTALNSVKMFCSRDGSWGSHWLESAAGRWGKWRKSMHCSKFYSGIQFRSEPSQGGGDDTAGNNVRLLCDGNWHWLEGSGLSWGRWTDAQYCPDNSFICALRTKVEGVQGGGDDTALNAIEVQCCYIN